MPSSATQTDARARHVEVSATMLAVSLDDGRTISAPLAWFPRLQRATSVQRDRWELLGDGIGIRWPDIDEDLSVEGLLQGRRSPEAP